MGRKSPPPSVAKVAGLKKVGLTALVAVVFFDVCGGPFGLESLVQQTGFGMALVLILVTPIIWAIPAAVMAAELGSAIPETGGYYRWVERAMGPFWGFLCGWWSWLYTFVDVAIYPVLFVKYGLAVAKLAGFGAFEPTRIQQWLMGLILIIPMTLLNIRGARTVGRTAVLFGVIVGLPFVLMAILGAKNVGPIHLGTLSSESLSSGLYIIMWNYLGWDSLSTIAEEIEEPQKVFPKALMICLPIVVLIYLVPVIVGWAFAADPKLWEEGAWPTILALVGGKWLGVLTAVAAVVYCGGEFMATMLGATRLPYALSKANRLPRSLSKLHPRHETPVAAILVSAAIYTILTWQTFEDLAKLDVILYTGALFLELVALPVLRYKEPDLQRPFKIPGGILGLAAVVVLPFGMLAFAVISSVKEDGFQTFGGAAVALATGPIVYFIGHRTRLRKGIT